MEHSRIASELDNKFNLKVAKFVSASEIPKLITANKPYIIHFSGHGKDPESGEHGATATSDDARLIALPGKLRGMLAFFNLMACDSSFVVGGGGGALVLKIDIPSFALNRCSLSPMIHLE